MTEIIKRHIILKLLLIFLILLACPRIYGQVGIYSTKDYSYIYHSQELEKQKIKGDIKNLSVLNIFNGNFHNNKLEIKLDSSIGSFEQYFLDENKIHEIRMYNQDSTIFMKQIFDNGKIKEELHFGKQEKLESQIFFYYNHFGEINNKIILECVTDHKFNIIYKYDKKNRLESVKGEETVNYKYTYDKSDGLYEIKYSIKNNKYTIVNVLYKKFAKTEHLVEGFEVNTNTKFNDVLFLKKSHQSIKRYDNLNRVVFEGWKNFGENPNESETTYKYEGKYLINKVFKTKMNDYSGTDIYTFIYEDDKLIRYYSINEKGVENHSETYLYNKHGDLLQRKEKIDLEEIHDFEYIYDVNNNWVLRREFLNKKLLKITYRAIEYRK